MPWTIRPTELTTLQSQVERIRNFGFLAHVDHGKTTLTDSLISENGIISQRLAGKMRYLDSREDEQWRGITMKSSAIALKHEYQLSDKTTEAYLMNLIDSPGHVDFSGEVLCALSVVDGAVVVIDVVEGVCSQTHTVLQLAAEAGVIPVLVLNKIDRLFVELRLSPLEAYQRIARVLEQANVILGIQEAEKQLETDDLQEMEHWIESDEYSFSPLSGNVAFASAIDGWAFRISDFVDIYAKKFNMKKQVLQYTLWGEYYYHSKQKKIVRKPDSIGKHARPMFVQFILENIFSVYHEVLLDASSSSSFDAIVEKRKKIIDKLGLSVSTRDIKHKEARTALQAIMSSWLPASRCLLDMIVEKLPDPRTAQKNRISFLFPADCAMNEEDDIDRAVAKCDSSKDAPVMIYISKMFSVPLSSLESSLQMRLEHVRSLARKENVEQVVTNKKEDTLKETRQLSTNDHTTGTKPDEEQKREHTLIGFARIFSGTFTNNQRLFVYGPRYHPTYAKSYVEELELSRLFLLMGRELIEISNIPAGNVFGIFGLENMVWKTATLSSLPPGKCIPFSPLRSPVSPVVRVAVEPKFPDELGKLKQGLGLLSQADPSVETYITETGELILAGAGELHLERCLKDLQQLFACIEIEVSPPLVYFKETVSGICPTESILASILEEETSKIIAYTIDRKKVNWSKMVKEMTSNGAVELRVVAFPLPKVLADVLDKSSEIIRKFLLSNSTNRDWFLQSMNKTSDSLSLQHTYKETHLCNARMVIQEALQQLAQLEGEETAKTWKSHLCRAWSLGPRRIGPNLLLGPPMTSHIDQVIEESYSFYQKRRPDGAAALQYLFNSEESYLFTPMSSLSAIPIHTEKTEEVWKTRLWIEIHNSIVSGFQVATHSGPLCEEAMYGVCFSVEEIRVDFDRLATLKTDPYGPLSGQVISAAKDAFRIAFICCGPRLMEPVYQCDIQVFQDALGPMYGLLSKRRGRVSSADMKEGVPFFVVTAYLPVVESFSFVDMLWKETSGAASPQMTLSHWEVIEKDPFWVPTTEEELEELSLEDSTTSRNNLARKLVEAIRRRKGLKVEQKLVEKAEKQRNLSRKK
eukprot:jgi/Galph1/2840/GphlegSOOS_G1500.1